jgi:hypothetical protein
MPRRTTAKILLAFLGAATILPASGCGDTASSDGGNGAEITVKSGSLTKAQFIKQAEGYCAREARPLQIQFFAYSKQSKSLSPAEKEEAAAKLVDESIVPTYEKQIERLSSLGVPPKDEKKLTAILEAVRQGLGEARQEPVKFLERASPFEKAARLGSAYGFFFCAGP